MLAKESFTLALTSPLQRARETCRLAGFGDVAHIEPDLVEWNYGRYEGLTPGQIHATAPGWLLFRDGGPGGEQPGEIGARVDRVIEKARAVKGNVILFAHGHVLRVFAARWLGLPPSEGQRFLLDTATMNILSYYRGIPAIKRWNAPVQF
jgi:probable phosphoglycerate mutase